MASPLVHGAGPVNTFRRAGLRRLLCLAFIGLICAHAPRVFPRSEASGPEEQGTERHVRSPRDVNSPRASGRAARTTIIGIGDSLTHGTMDGTNNSINTQHAYLQLVADALGQSAPVVFSQPLFDFDESRIDPSTIPTNVGVDGADSFTLEGLAYYKRADTAETLPDDELLCNNWLARRLDSTYDKVLYPINVKARRAVSQIDAAIWHLQQLKKSATEDRALLVFWVGNNDSSSAALGTGGARPEYFPIPAEQIEDQVTPALRLLLRFGEQRGLVAFDPYTLTKIDRHLTDLADFAAQYGHLVDRLVSESGLSADRFDVFLLTLPYYSAVGYLFDSDDLEFYLRKVNPDYVLPPTFARVAAPGEPIVDSLRGDRVSLLTFGLMYTLLHTGSTVEFVNQVLQVNGVQRDGLVLSESEQQYIMARIDAFNEVIRDTAGSLDANVHLIDTGDFLNDRLSGQLPVVIGGRPLSRKWVRGGGFCLDGVHPGYTGQALIANYILEHLFPVPPRYNLDAIAATDPYVDHDGDGWAPGPGYPSSGLTTVLFLLADPDDTDASVQLNLPADVWEQISDALLADLLGVPALAEEASRLGISKPSR